MNGLPYGRLEYTTILFAHTRSKAWIQLVHLHSSLASLPRWCRLFLMASGRTRILCGFSTTGIIGVSSFFVEKKN
jgi:hypothetical protein